MIGQRKLGPSSLKLSISKALPDSMQDGIREVSNIKTNVKERGKGHATTLLKSVCEEADKARKILLLTPDTPQLKRFYWRFGFTVIQQEPVLMARRPR